MAGTQRLATVVATVAVEEGAGAGEVSPLPPLLPLRAHLMATDLPRRQMKMAAAAAADGDGGKSRRAAAAGGRWDGGGCGSDGAARGALKAQGGCMGASRPWRREARERRVDFTELLLRWCGFYGAAPSFTTLFLPTLSYLPPGHCQRSRGVPILDYSPCPRSGRPGIYNLFIYIVRRL